MENVFELMTGADRAQGDEIVVNVGVRVKIGSQETSCPISGPCSSYEAVEMEVQAIRNSLDAIMERAKEVFRQTTVEGGFGLSPDMEPEQIWAVLSEIADEDLFIKGFNGLEEAKRKELAEHVLTRCNVFSGKAAIFSSRYNNETGLLE
jgi:hypothetical protein